VHIAPLQRIIQRNSIIVLVSPVKSILSLLQFCTILPLGKAADFEYFARRSYLYPVAGYVTGGIAAAATYLIASPVLAAAVAVATVLVVTGFNHFDGLLDFGDGAMVHGNSERRIQAMTDRSTGAGAVACGIIVTLLAFAGLQAGEMIWAAILAGEILAKLAMAYMTVLGRPFRDGIHSYLHRYAKPEFLIYATVFALPILLLPFSGVQLAGAGAAAIIVVAGMLAVSQRLFGGVNGDVVGATHEITRAGVIIALALL
jgi:adenosylcobinamide-GDP ribazoletransferase